MNATTSPTADVSNSPISRLALLVRAFGCWARTVPGPARLPADVVYRILDLLVVKLLIGADLPREAVLGDDVVLGHGAKGIVIGDNAVVGSRVMIYHQVTIGRNVVVGNDVYIGPGAKILPRAVVGDNVRIGANAVVIGEVPANSTAVGVPARVLRREAQE